MEQKFSKVILEKIKRESLRIGINQQKGLEVCSVFEWALTEQRHEQFVAEVNQLYTKYRTYAEIDIRSLKEDFIPCTGVISIGRYELW